MDCGKDYKMHMIIYYAQKVNSNGIWLTYFCGLFSFLGVHIFVSLKSKCIAWNDISKIS